MANKLTLEEFEAWFNDPVFQRLRTISQDVHEGRADAETVEAFNDLRDTIMRVMDTAERALVRYEPEKREAVLRKWIDEFVAERFGDEPTRH